MSSETVNLRELLPEELRGDTSLQDFKDVGSLAKSYVHLNKMQGSQIRVPGSDAGREDLEKFYEKALSVPGLMRSPDLDNKEAMASVYKKLGRPDQAADYEESISASDIPQGMSYDRQMMTDFKKVAYDVGLSRQQASALMQFELGRYEQMQSQTTMQLDDAKTTLKSSWGEQYTQRKSGVAAVKRHYLNSHPQYMQQLEAVAGTNPVLAMIMADAGINLSEKGHIDSSVKYAGVTPNDAKFQIAEIRNNKEHPWHKGDAAAKNKMRKLYQAAYPSDK